MNLYFKKPRKLRILTLGLSVFIAGCNIGDIPDLDNTYLPDYEGNIAILLVKDTLVIQEFLDEVITDSSAIQSGDNQEIVFRYETSAEFTVGDDFVNVESFSNSEYIPSPINFTYTTPRDTTLYISREIPFNLPSSKGEAVDSVFYSSGLFVLEMNSGFPAEVNYSFSTTSFQNISTGESIAYASSVQTTAPPVIDVQSTDLEGYKTYLTNEGDSNKFFIQVDASIFIEEGTTLTGNEYLNFKLDVEDPEFETVFGDFGQDTINIPTKRISLGIFSDFSGTGIEFDYPEISFQIENSFGIPLDLDFKAAYAEYSEQDDLPFSGSIADNLQEVSAPSVENYTYPVVQSEVKINPDNSNLREMLSTSPDRLVLPLVGYSNLDNADQNFVSGDSRIDINAVISLPLKVKLDAFEYESIVELDGLDELEGTQELSLLFRTTNELPFDGTIDLYFVDENDNRFDSLKNNVLFKAPTAYDAVGKATEPSLNATEIKLDESLVNSLTTAASLTLVTRLNSYGYEQDEFVQVFSDYTLITSLSIAGKLSVNLNGN